MATYLYPPLSVTLSGGATEAKQDDAIALLTTIDADTSLIAIDTAIIAADTTSLDAKAPALGTALIVASTPVNIASDQVVNITVTTELPAGTQNIGDVDIASAIPAGSNTIGDVGIIAGSATIGNVNINAITPIDFLDSGVVDASSSNIPAAGLTIVASLAADCVELEIVEDIGEFMTITDGADAILAYLPLGGGRVKLSVTSTTALKLASVSGATITSGKIAINFLG